MRIAIIAACAAALALGGCATGKGITPEQAQATIKTFHDAGCGGTFGVHGGASTGQLGGQASLNIDITADCPKAEPAPTFTPGTMIVPSGPNIPVTATPG